jgi:molybdopterin converting factor small subunit
MIRVVLPAHLQKLARVTGEVAVEVEGAVTLEALLDALEEDHPTLRGAIRDRATRKRRPFVRFFACEEYLSHAAPDTPLPDAVVTGAEPFLVVGAMAARRPASTSPASGCAPRAPPPACVSPTARPTWSTARTPRSASSSAASTSSTSPTSTARSPGRPTVHAQGAAW